VGDSEGVLVTATVAGDAPAAVTEGPGNCASGSKVGVAAGFDTDICVTEWTAGMFGAGVLEESTSGVTPENGALCEGGLSARQET